MISKSSSTVATCSKTLFSIAANIFFLFLVTFDIFVHPMNISHYLALNIYFANKNTEYIDSEANLIYEFYLLIAKDEQDYSYIQNIAS